MVLLHCGYIIYVMSSSTTMVVSRSMELILGISEEAIQVLSRWILKLLRDEEGEVCVNAIFAPPWMEC